MAYPSPLLNVFASEWQKQNDIITELVFDITPLANLKEANVNSVKLYLQYKNFGLVEDFEIK